MNLSSFNLRSVSFEIRYEPSYLIWDRAGSFTNEIMSMVADSKVETANPSNVLLTIGKNCQVNAQADRTSITGYPSDALKIEQFYELTKKIASLITSTLEIKTYTRVGLRPIFIQDHKNKYEATEPILKAGLLKIIEGKNFNIEGKIALPHYAVLWEDEDMGLTINIRSEEKNLKANPPLGETRVEAVNIDISELIIDLDYFTKGRVAVQKFDAIEWMKQTMHVLRRDASVLIGN